MPLKARRQTWLYKTRKFIARHAAAAGAALIMVVLLAAGVIATRHEASVAQRRFTELRGLAKSLLFEVYPAIEKTPGATQARDLLLRRGLEYLDRLAREARGETELQVELAAAYENMGNARAYNLSGHLGDPEGGLESYRKSGAALDDLLRRSPDSFVYLRDRARIWGRTGEMLRRTGNFREAFNAYEHRAELCEKLHALRPADTDVDLLRAAAYMGMGDVAGSYHRRGFGGLGAAAKYFSTALDIHEALLGKEPGNRQMIKAACKSLNGAGDALLLAGKTEAALHMYRRTLSLSEGLARGSQDNESRRALQLVYTKIGRVSLFEGDAQSAMDSFRRSMKLAQEMAQKDPDNAQARRDVAIYQAKVGEALLQLNQPRQALEQFRQPCALFAETAQSSSNARDARGVLVICHHSIASALLAMEDAGGALSQCDLGIKLAKSLLAAEPSDLMISRNLLLNYAVRGDALLQSGRYREALESSQQGLRLAEELAGLNPDHIEFRICRARMRAAAGRTYAHLARRSGSRVIRHEHLRAAQTWMTRGLHELTELRTRGTWYRREDREVNRIASELAKIRTDLGSGSEGERY
jgi:tetratricopeptide (TPR) repeat protein